MTGYSCSSGAAHSPGTAGSNLTKNYIRQKHPLCCSTFEKSSLGGNLGQWMDPTNTRL